MDAPVIRNCPFCGAAGRSVRHSAGMRGTMGYDQWHGVSCVGCNACVGASDRRFRTVAEAIAAWNQRPTHEVRAGTPASLHEAAETAFALGQTELAAAIRAGERELRAELEAAKPDAERYRWLELEVAHGILAVCEWFTFTRREPHWSPIAGALTPYIDAVNRAPAIDAEMAKG